MSDFNSLLRTKTTLLTIMLTAAPAAAADLILHHGKILAVDHPFGIHQALAVREGRILQVGGDEEILELRTPQTEVIDLAGRTVLPGLIDSHTHPGGASMTEFDHSLPDFQAIEDVLQYVRLRTRQLERGEWIVLRQVFITRLEDRRYPTRAELDAAAPRHPVIFATGPDASLNSLALAHFGIDRDSEAPPGSKIEKGDDGEPTGIVRNRDALGLDIPPSSRSPSDTDRLRRLQQLLGDYTSVGLTTVADRAADWDVIERYQQLREAGQLPLRVTISKHVATGTEIDKVLREIDRVAEHPLRSGGASLRIVGIKTFLDGGMLTGSAYMRRPWGVSDIYGIDDPGYRGLRFIEAGKLAAMVRAAAKRDMQFTAHSVGDGAVHALIEAYEQVSQDTPLRKTRPCITHCNFMSPAAIEKMAELGIVADIQPAWLWLDTATLHRQFGTQRLRWFQPLATLFQHGVVVGGGSDHMQKIGSRRSVNPYDPWLGMWITLTRRARGFEGRLHSLEALSREQAIRFYTINNAFLLRLEDELGSLEPGKLADLIVVDRDVLTCNLDELRQTQVLRTYVGGELTYARER